MYERKERDLLTSKKNLLEGDIASHLRRLSLPLVFSLMVIAIAQIFDTYYISRLGTHALAAIGFTMPLVMFFMGIIFGLSIGTSSILSRAYGEGDIQKFKRLATDSLILTIIIATIAAITGYILIDPIFKLMGATDDLLPLIHSYMAIWYCGIIFLTLMIIGNSCIRATGNTKFPAIIMVTSASIGICLNPFLIFGIGPFPELGLPGAATTLIIAYSITCCVSFYYLKFKKNILITPLFHAETLGSWKKILHVGLPAIISNLITPISSAIIIWMISDIGKEAVAALGISTRIEGFIIMIFYAITSGAAIFTGQNYGAGNYGRINQMIKIAAKYSIFYGISITILLWMFADSIPLLFDTNPKVLFYASQYLHIVPISYCALGILLISCGTLNAMGKPIPATIISLLRAVILYVPLAWIGNHYYGFLGIITALTFTNIIVGIFAYLWNKKIAS